MSEHFRASSSHVIDAAAETLVFGGRGCSVSLSPIGGDSSGK